MWVDTHAKRHASTRPIQNIARAAVVVGVALTAGHASAGDLFQETQTQDFFLNLPNSHSLSFLQFDTQDGARTLEAVDISITGNVGANATAENLNPTTPAPDFFVRMLGLLTVDIEDMSLLTMFDESFLVPHTLAPYDGVPGEGDDYYSFGRVEISNNSFSRREGDFAPFIGTGMLDAEIDGTGGFLFGGTTAAEVTLADFEAYGSVTITYFYSAIPAPGTVVLLGIALLGCAKRRRRTS